VRSDDDEAVEGAVGPGVTILMKLTISELADDESAVVDAEVEVVARHSEAVASSATTVLASCFGSRAGATGTTTAAPSRIA
jgi:hypothetical protein